MERVIRVTGRGKISVKPDTIRLSISATRVCKEFGDDVKASADDTSVLRETIEKAGLNPTDLKTTRFNIDSEYEGYHDKKGDYRRRHVGYRYNHNLYVQFPNDNEQLGRVLYELANCEVTVEFSIRHTVKDVEAVKNELLGNAVEDSRAKAEVLSKSAGVSLGEIKTIDYSWGELEIYTQPIDRMMVMENHKYLAAPGSYDIDIEADDIDVQDTVTVVWEINN